MIRSMTGYGAADIGGEGYRLTVEARSVNGRFCEVRARLPGSIAPLESKVVALVQQRVSRGTISVSVNRNGSLGNERPSLDLAAAKTYHEDLSRLKEAFGLDGEIELGLLAGLPGVFSRQEASLEAQDVWPLLEKACNAALDDLDRMREAEGRALQQDFVERTGTLERLLSEVEALAPLRVERARDRLRQRTKELLGGQALDEMRLEMEVALMAERSDITEECVRARSHCEQFVEALNQEQPGRRLGFLLQELQREANTLAAKANDVDISILVVRVKEEIEKLREQVQNVE